MLQTLLDISAAGMVAVPPGGNEANYVTTCPRVSKPQSVAADQQSTNNYITIAHRPLLVQVPQNPIPISLCIAAELSNITLRHPGLLFTTWGWANSPHRLNVTTAARAALHSCDSATMSSPF